MHTEQHSTDPTNREVRVQSLSNNLLSPDSTSFMRDESQLSFPASMLFIHQTVHPNGGLEFHLVSRSQLLGASFELTCSALLRQLLAT